MRQKLRISVFVLLSNPSAALTVESQQLRNVLDVGICVQLFCPWPLEVSNVVSGLAPHKQRPIL
jgi:hypothetical protein